MIEQEDARIYFGREILDILKEGDLIEAKKEFPFINNKRAVYNGHRVINLRPKKIDAVEIIGRRNSDDKIITEIRYDLEDVSLIGRKIINPRDEFFEEFEEEPCTDPVDIFCKRMITGRIWFYSKEDERYDRFCALLSGHGL